MPHFVFFSDLDSTLLDHDTYSFEEAKPALQRIRQTNSSLVFCTSKTKTESLDYEEKFSLREPFIVENGGAIYIPKGYFKHGIAESVAEQEYLALRLGTDAKELEAVVNTLSKKIDITPFHRMGILEVMQDLGLNEEQARKAKDRHFTASFKNPGKEMVERARTLVEKKGYTLTVGGRYCAVMRGSDKGKAVQTLLQHYRKDFANVVSVGLGDAPNDFPMLRGCDKAFLVAKKNGSYSSNEFPKADGVGPGGWNKAVLEVLRDG